MNAQVEQQRGEVMRTVLCAVDLTARSHAVLRRAILLTRGIGAKLSVLHVVHSLRSRRALRAESNRAYIQLLTAVERAAGTGSSNVDVMVRTGEPFEMIAALTGELDVEVVVIGAPQPRPADAIIGTAAERLLRATRRPILVVRQNAAAEYRHAVVAIDLSEATVSVLRSAHELGMLGSETTTFVHTQPVYESKPLAVSDQPLTECHNLRGQLSRRAHELFVAAGLDPAKLRVLFSTERPVPAIRALLEQERPELLVVGASRWFLFKRLLVGSVADEVLRSAACDVLVIPPSSALKTSRSSAFVRDRDRAPPAAARSQ